MLTYHLFDNWALTSCILIMETWS